MAELQAPSASNRIKLMERNQHWSEGRLVVIRPDVPGKRFDPEDSVILRTVQERLAAEVALDALYDEVQSRKGKPPEWYDLMA